MGKTSIEWTEETWNPVRGCRKISAGCKHCYAEAFAERWRGVPGHPYERGFDPRFVPSALNAPTTWRKPRRVFVNSMSDLFLEDFTNEQIASVFGVMAQTPQHTYQVLTKRAKRMREWFEWIASFELDHGPPPDDVVTTMATNYGADIDHLARPWPLPNVWLGVSVEDQQSADDRIPELLCTPAHVRFLSCEPLLDDASLWAFLRGTIRDASLTALGSLPLPGIDWTIVGGESGRGARRFELAWARSIVAECKAAGVPVFVKQLGASASDPVNGVAGASLKVHPDAANLISLRLKDRKGGDWSEWPEDLRVRQWPGGV